MDQEQRQVSNLWFPGAIVVSLMAAGYILNQPALQSARPVDNDKWSQESTGHQDVEARLWQDPFFAVDQHIKEMDALRNTTEASRVGHDQATHKAEYVKRGLRDRLDRHGSGNRAAPLVLVVTAPGAPYSEQAERRRRVRYAILSGLFAVGYAPEDEEHVGFFRPSKASSHDARLPPVVPYEFVRVDRLTKWDGKKRPWIMVVWLDNEALDDSPLSTIRTILDDIRPPNDKSVEYQVIGPSTSGALIKLARSARQDQSGVVGGSTSPAHTWSPPLTFWSPWASVSETELCMAELGEKCAGQPRDLEERMRETAVRLVRLTPDNDDLVEALLRELQLRGVDPVGAARRYRNHLLETIYTFKKQSAESAVLSSHVPATNYSDGDLFTRALHSITPNPKVQRHRLLIISEFDTPYQRSLLQSFRRIVGDSCDGVRDGNVNCPSQDGSFSWIYRFSYLRGIDGQVPASKEPKSDSDQTGKRNGKNEHSPARTFEDPFGNGQFDYLRRLADRIESEEASLESQGQSGFGAIGVLGMDTYDKLTVLQALTTRFPGRIFFTTGHDARYLNLRESKWARNLVVVSPFGLELDSRLQRGVPPFRDAYQTAAFFATLVAIAPESVETKVQEIELRRKYEAFLQRPDSPYSSGKGEDSVLKNRWLYPLTFEVGRTDAFLYPARGMRQENSKEKCGPWNLPACREFQTGPPVSMAHPSENQLLPACAAVILSLAMIFVLWRFQGPVSVKRTAFLVGVGVVAMLAIWRWRDLLDYLSEHGRGEPTAFLEGISIWPAQLIRLLAFLVSLGALIYFHFKLKQNVIEIHKKLELELESSPATLQPEAEVPNPVPVAAADSVRVSAKDTASTRSPCFLEGSAITGEALYLSRPGEFRGDWWPKIGRAACIALLFFGLGYFLTLVWPVGVPARGRFSYEINFWVTMISVGTYSLLLAYVLDSFQSNIWFIRAMRTGTLTWTRDLVNASAARLKAGRDCVPDWLTVQVISQRTRAVSTLIYGPFAVLFIVVLARSSVFEHWFWPKSLLLIVGLSILMMIYAAVSLRRETERTRNEVLERLRDRQMQAQGANRDEEVNQLKSMINEIRALRKGAFASYTDQPFLRAPLLLVAGYAGNLLIEYLALPGR